MISSENRHPVRRRLAGFLLGFGLAGFLSRFLIEFTLWFGTARTSPRPLQGFNYPVTEHGVTYYVSAGEVLVHDGIPVFWLIAVLGMVLTPRQPDPGRKWKAYDPDGSVMRWRLIGAFVCLAVTVLVHPLADELVRRDWRPPACDISHFCAAK